MSKAVAFQQDLSLTPSAKTFVLIEALNKIANVTLASNEIREDKSSKDVQNKTPFRHNSITTAEKGGLRKLQFDEGLTIHSNTMRIAKKYFLSWKAKVKEKRKSNGNDKKEKIDLFLEQLKKYENDQGNKDALSEIEKSNKCPKYIKKRKKDVSEIYRNRHKAQEDLIKTQKTKLQEQEEIIKNLKLGIIIEETEKSVENAKYEIREIFRDCSERVRCKITPPEAVEKNIHVIELKSNKAPKIIAQMEKRAEERMLKRNIILQRKRILEETKRKDTEIAIERKKVADEEQRQKNLEVIKERRRLEAEIIKQRQLNKQKYLESINKALKFHKKRMKRITFNAFKTMMEMKYEIELKSEIFFETSLQKKCLNKWKLFVQKKIEKESFDANCLYEYKLKKSVFKSWRLALISHKQSMQVAEDLYDMKLQSRMFLHWHRYICRQQMIEFKNVQIAEKHYNSRILLQYFYQWKSLPAVLQLEKAKEAKKRKWREKVWEILPDYQPYTEVA